MQGLMMVVLDVARPEEHSRRAMTVYWICDYCASCCFVVGAGCKERFFSCASEARAFRKSESGRRSESQMSAPANYSYTIDSIHSSILDTTSRHATSDRHVNLPLPTTENWRQRSRSGVSSTLWPSSKTSSNSFHPLIPRHDKPQIPTSLARFSSSKSPTAKSRHFVDPA